MMRKKWRKSPLFYWHNHQLINNNNNNNNNEHRSHSPVHKPTTVYWTKSSPVQRCFMFNAQIHWNKFKSGLIFLSFNFVVAFLRLMHAHLMRPLNNNNILKSTYALWNLVNSETINGAIGKEKRFRWFNKIDNNNNNQSLRWALRAHSLTMCTHISLLVNEMH